jgi:hypothetical protein
MNTPSLVEERPWISAFKLAHDIYTQAHEKLARSRHCQDTTRSLANVLAFLNQIQSQLSNSEINVEDAREMLARLKDRLEQLK